MMKTIFRKSMQLTALGLILTSTDGVMNVVNHLTVVK